MSYDSYLPSESLFSPDIALPAVRTAHMQKTLKGEDADFTADKHLSGEGKLPISVHAVFDGHNGNKTAFFCRKYFVETLLPRLPSGPIPPETDTKSFEEYLSSIRTAVNETFVEMDSLSIAAGCNSGCTASVLLVTGWLATVANVGDSDILLQTKSSGYRVLTQSHRIGESEEEVSRMCADGHLVAQLSPSLKGPAKAGEQGVGPVRVWPGGLCVSRAIGDDDVGATVLAHPHIRQIAIPQGGARFAIASDGIWDGLKVKKAATLMKSKALKQCAQELVRHAMMGTGLTDDTTVLVVDVVPSKVADFHDQFPKQSSSRMLMCVSPVANNDDDDVSPLRVFADVDTHKFS